MSAEQQQIPVEQVSGEEQHQAPVGALPVKSTCPSGTACSKGAAPAAPAAEQTEVEAAVGEEANWTFDATFGNATVTSCANATPGHKSPSPTSCAHFPSFEL